MLGCPCICIPVCLCQRFSCCCVCLRSCVLAHAHVYTLCPYACNRLQLLLCFCTPVGQIARPYTCMIELLTTVCLYVGMVLVDVPTLLCICVDAWLYVCMSLSLFFCVLNGCKPFGVCLFFMSFLPVYLCAWVHMCICACSLKRVSVVFICLCCRIEWNDCVDPWYGEGDGHGCHECLALAGYGRCECGMRFGPIFAYLLMIVWWKRHACSWIYLDACMNAWVPVYLYTRVLVPAFFVLLCVPACLRACSRACLYPMPVCM